MVNQALIESGVFSSSTKTNLVWKSIISNENSKINHSPRLGLEYLMVWVIQNVDFEYRIKKNHFRTFFYKHWRLLLKKRFSYLAAVWN